MGFFDFGGDDYYDSDAQIINEVSAEAPYKSMLDYNICLMDGQVSLTGWSQLYFKNGKGSLLGYINYTKHLEKIGDTTLSCYIATDSASGANPDSTLLSIVLNDLGYTTEDVTETSISLLNPNSNTRLYIKYLLDNYDYNNDNVIINGTVFTIKSFDYKNVSVITVILEDTEGNTLEKELPMYAILDTSDIQLKASDYLYIEYTTSDGIKHVFMQQVPVSGNTNVYTYTDKNGSSYNYATTSQKQTSVLPLISIKEGGDGQGWGHGKMTAYRKLKSSYTKGGAKSWFDYTGILSEDGSTVVVTGTDGLRVLDYNGKKWKEEKYRNTLYRKCKFEGRRDEYKVFKQAAKKAGLDIRQQIGVLYDGQCGFLDSISSPDDLVEQIYSAYFGYGCPLHGVKSTNILKHPVSEYETVYARLAADTDNPFIAEYAKWSRYTDENTLESDEKTNKAIKRKQQESSARSSAVFYTDAYDHKYFIEINKKKYKPLTMKAIAKYMYNFFDLYDNAATAYGKEIEIVHKQGQDYYATHSWTQYKKTSHEGKLKYKYMYGFSAEKKKMYYLYSIKFTGRYDVQKTYQTDSKNWKLTYRPIYEVKSYSCTIIRDTTDDTYDLAELSGIPIQATYYDEKGKVLNSFTDSEGNTINYSTIGVVSYEDPSLVLKLSDKQLINIKETTTINLANITFANSTLTSTSTTTSEDGTETTVINTKGTYATDTTELCTAYFYGDLDVTKLEYDAEVMEYTEIKEGTEDTPPEASTDITYDNFSTSLLPETETTYIFFLAPKENNVGTDATFRYMYQYDATHYYEIKVNGYKVVWKINMYEDHQEKTAPYSGLAPDGPGFIPIVPSIIKKLSLQEGVIIRNYALKQYWSFWVHEHVSWWEHYGIGLVISVILIAVQVAIAIATGGTQLNLQAVLTKIAIAALTSLAIHQVVKLLGLDNTILGSLIELAANIAAGYGLSNISSLNITFDFNFIGKQVLSTLQNLTNLVINKRMEDIAQDFQKEEERINDVQVEIENAQNQGGIGLATQATVKRLRGQNLTIPETYAISTTVVTDTIAMYNKSIAQMGYNYVKNSTSVTLPWC